MKSYCALFAMTFLALVGCQQSQPPADVPIPREYNRSEAASLNTRLGLAYLKKGNMPRAKKKILLALSQAPESPLVNGAMAYFLERTGNISAAKNYYLKAMKFAPNGGAQMNNFGAFLCRQGHYEEAEEYFLKAANDVRYENTAGAFENAGLCAIEIPDYKKAETYFKKALQQDPARKSSLYELVKIELKQGNTQAALTNIQKHPQVSLKSAFLLKKAIQAAHKEGDMQLALNYQKQLKHLNSFSESTGVKYEYNRDNG